MTTRFFRAASTFAVALVLLAGCDSAGPDVGGLAATAGSEIPPVPFVNAGGCYTGAFGASDFGTSYSSTFAASGSTRYLRLTAQATGTATDYKIAGSINVNGTSYSYDALPGAGVTVRLNNVTAGSPLTVTAGRAFIVGGGGGGTYDGLVKFSVNSRSFTDACRPNDES